MPIYLPTEVCALFMIVGSFVSMLILNCKVSKFC